MSLYFENLGTLISMTIKKEHHNTALHLKT